MDLSEIEGAGGTVCPHCGVAIFVSLSSTNAAKDKQGLWLTQSAICPNCQRAIIQLRMKYARPEPMGILSHTPDRVILAYPRAAFRPACPAEVPNEIGADYTEACLVLSDSPKSAAALARRCLQHLLRDYAKVKHQNLAKEIQEVLDSGKLPLHLTESLDSVRIIGNFAAHPTKSTASGEIIDVEPGEAEWTLSTLEALFVFYFVEPAKAAAKRSALGAKVAESKKLPIK
jgi:hypothetical protein